MHATELFPRRRSSQDEWRWRCQEYGHVYRNAEAADRALSHAGCPTCGGYDADCSLPLPREVTS